MSYARWEKPLTVGIGAFSVDEASFIIWAGNDSSDLVDANHRAFAFYVNNGCLFNFQTRRANPHFCLTTLISERIRLKGKLFLRLRCVLSRALSEGL